MANYQMMWSRGQAKHREEEAAKARAKATAEKRGLNKSDNSQYPDTNHNSMSTEEVNQGHRYGNYWN